MMDIWTCLQVFRFSFFLVSVVDIFFQFPGIWIVLVF